MRADLAPNLWGAEIIFRRPNFRMTFLGKNFQIFLVINRFFLFSFTSSHILIYNIVYHSLFFTKNVYLIKTISLLHFFVSCYNFRTLPITLLLQILGDECIGRPHLKFWGTVPPVPPRSPPMDQLLSQDKIDGQGVLHVMIRGPGGIYAHGRWRVELNQLERQRDEEEYNCQFRVKALSNDNKR